MLSFITLGEWNDENSTFLGEGEANLIFHAEHKHILNSHEFEADFRGLILTEFCFACPFSQPSLLFSIATSVPEKPAFIFEAQIPVIIEDRKIVPVVYKAGSVGIDTGEGVGIDTSARVDSLFGRILVNL